MPLYLEWPAGSVLIDESQSPIIGRSNTVDVSITNYKVSRHHMLLTFNGSSWLARDLGSANGSYTNNVRFSELEIKENTVIRLGGNSGIVLRITLIRSENPNNAKPESIDYRIQNDSFEKFLLKERIRLGSDPSNDIVLATPAEKFHCEIITSDGKIFEIVDLSQSNNTLVDGKPVKRKRLLIGNVISVFDNPFRFTGSSIEEVDNQDKPILEIENLTVFVKNKKLLNQISFSVKPNTLTAVIGPSGSGKSTLFKVLTGSKPPHSGRVRFAGSDLYQNLSTLRRALGYVPQADLLHTNLSIKNALTFAADLRFPSSTNKEARKKRIDEVSSGLGLADRMDLRIDKLSGGQRKRTSIALELLTEPSLLFLDEPTSGLDPDLDRQVMQILRDLADNDQTIFVVTHSTENLDLCDQVLVLAAGGEKAYFGSPFTILKALGAENWASAFNNLSSIETSDVADLPFTQLDEIGGNKIRLSDPVPWISQVSTLVKRYLAVISADKAYLGFLALMPLVLAAVGVITGGELGLAPGGPEQGGLNPQARSMLLVLILGAAFMGASASIQEIVKERAIYMREFNTGLSPSAYIASKVIVLGSINALQVIVFTWLTLAGRPIPVKGVFFGSPLIELTIPIVLLAFTSLLIGLLISQVVKTAEVTMPVLVVVTMIQVVLSGAVPLRFDQISNTVAVLTPSHWAMNSLSSTVDLNTLMGTANENAVNKWLNSVENFTTSTLLLVLFSFLFLVMLMIIDSFRIKKHV